MSFLKFDRTGMSKSGLTEIWAVTSTSGVPLGTIMWYSHWRKYTFHPGYATTYDTNCLIEIATFLQTLQKNRES